MSNTTAETSEAREAASTVIYSFDGRRFAPHEHVRVAPFDFRNPTFLSDVELRQLQSRHEQFLHYLEARLSMFLRIDFRLKLSELTSRPYEEFTGALANPTYLSLFRIDGLNGVGIVEFSPKLAMAIVDRLLGGKGVCKGPERYLTDIEVALMDDILNLLLEEWRRQWEDVRDLNPLLIGHENNGRFLQTSPRDATMLVLKMEATMGEIVEGVQVAIPYTTIEPILKALSERTRRYEPTKEARAPARWSKAYDGILAPVKAEWKAFESTVRDVLALRPGDLIELPQSIIGETIVSLAGAERFKGEVGIDGDRVAVKLVSPIVEQNLGKKKELR